MLFGPTPPAEWGPPPDRPRHQVLWAGGRGDPHADTPDPGLLAITVQDVLDALKKAPTEKPAGAGSRRAAGVAPCRAGSLRRIDGDRL